MTDRFVIGQNIERFRRLLANGGDDLARTILTELLEAEEHKLARLKAPPDDEEPGD
jgi:hypothetical protein